MPSSNGHGRFVVVACVGLAGASLAQDMHRSVAMSGSVRGPRTDVSALVSSPEAPPDIQGRGSDRAAESSSRVEQPRDKMRWRQPCTFSGAGEEPSVVVVMRPVVDTAAMPFGLQCISPALVPQPHPMPAAIAERVQKRKRTHAGAGTRPPPSKVGSLTNASPRSANVTGRQATRDGTTGR
ncbi:uncharacterized protein BJ171DRAFT_479054 [Polychytrium aggregatum]|uniref:uncharacterized protein n=1 Tax=Polychytrium aggregatum TaxID=110093 RepID=UPI0022FF3B3A|nr:uncharacterized protein BJ171DRAFT_479054 [Polychytrium aggregatum]KAI9193474.1 hypothetical protein BJ171DRAFT_479054 [Polychytrium aggregatum]